MRLAPAKSKSAGAEASIPVRSQKPARPCAVEQDQDQERAVGKKEGFASAGSVPVAGLLGSWCGVVLLSVAGLWRPSSPAPRPAPAPGRGGPGGGLRRPRAPARLPRASCAWRPGARGRSSPSLARRARARRASFGSVALAGLVAAAGSLGWLGRVGSGRPGRCCSGLFGLAFSSCFFPRFVF